MESTSDRVSFYEAAPRLANGRHLFEGGPLPTTDNLEAFRAGPAELIAAEGALRALGLTPVARNDFTITISVDALRPMAGFCVASMDDASCLRLRDPASDGYVGGLAVLAPGEFSALPPLPPPAGYFHLRAPGDLQVVLNGVNAAAAGWTGRGTHVAVVDSGCYVEHPFFRQRNAEITVVLGPGASDPDVDTLGHGTMICGNVVSIAPRTRVTMIKTTDDASLAAFKQAVALKPRPDVIQNAWGNPSDGSIVTAYDRAVQAAVLDAIAKGCVVVFAAGNAKILFPPQIPEAIGVGGAYINERGQIIASTYASGYRSVVFDGRIVPDFCGLVGPWPAGVYIALPTAPGSIIDSYSADRRFPDGDDGFPDDGWVVISGTSAASAQVSGAVALLRQIDRKLNQAAVKEILARTALKVDIGTSAQGSPSGPPYPNLATGFGLIDIGRAIETLEADHAAKKPKTD
ncbi:peptidase S8 (plasmid) [Aminobacter sp. Y103A]|uniref:S8 family serine peptidase n=1 Tax=Mesorhizobium sp. L-2-11 TaxID=2744521 RepID=UPI0018EBD4AD|nr:S8 family serine peptidase [Mesorhizobium sp. L-2-11]BBD41328.1 peptidase S8 [Aminobacter sp. SS-2016]BCH20117.1 hypothetical protein MesoLjLa_69680 [Mesorhizobium sp. L-2-11]